MLEANICGALCVLVGFLSSRFSRNTVWSKRISANKKEFSKLACLGCSNHSVAAKELLLNITKTRRICFCLVLVMFNMFSSSSKQSKSKLSEPYEPVTSCPPRLCGWFVLLGLGEYGQLRRSWGARAMGRQKDISPAVFSCHPRKTPEINQPPPM